jgi:hypothetical protein
MDRLTYIKARLEERAESRDNQVSIALIRCLSPDEVCSLFDSGFGQPYWVRKTLAERISDDVRRDPRPCHARLYDTLPAALPALPAAKRAACAHGLLLLANAVGQEEERRLLTEFLGHSDGNIRKQAYRRIKELPIEVWQDLLRTALVEHADPQGAITLIKQADESTLREDFYLLEALVQAEGYYLSRLYLRLRGQAPATLDRLRDLDQLSYVYVATKLGIQLPTDEFVTIYRQYLFDHRAGLLVWFCGKAQAWDALIEIEKLIEHPPADALKRFEESLGLPLEIT